MRKVAVERKGETNFFTSSMIKECIKKVQIVSLHETVQVKYSIVLFVVQYHKLRTHLSTCVMLLLCTMVPFITILFCT